MNVRAALVVALGLASFLSIAAAQHPAPPKAKWTAADLVPLPCAQAWVKSGKLKVQEDIIEGFENIPAALIGLLAGENRGKRMVRV